MGGNYGDNPLGRSRWRSYGLVEIGWYRRPHGRGWPGEHFAVQAHRLRFGDEMLDDAVAARYGRFGGLVLFDELRQELTRRDVALVPVGEPDLGSQQYWQPEAQTTVYVSEDPEHEPGDVQKIFSAFGQTPGLAGDHRVVWQQLKALALMSPAERERWAQRQQDTWWRFATRLAATRIPEGGTRSELLFWLTRRGVHMPAEAALIEAEFVRRLEDGDALDDDVPSHDALIAACLDQVTPAMTRTDKNLVDAAVQLRHGASDPSRLDEMYLRRTLPVPSATP